MSIKIGITGGIGSGKTTVCQIFETIGIPVYYADEQAKALMTDNNELVNAIKRLLGKEAYRKDGSLDRKFIAEVVFSDKAKLDQLNALVHPAVWEDGNRWHEKQKTAYTIKEAALLFESGGYQLMDAVITVTAPKKIRIKRVMDRDGVSEKQVLARMNKQWPDSKKIVLSDFIIKNDGDIFLIPQVLQVHRHILDTLVTNTP